MICEDTRGELVAYCFGVLEDRSAVEEHLLGCRACLAHFFELKRGIELGEQAPAPPERVHARLRAAVADELRPRLPARRSRARWERPVALALAASVVLVAASATRALTAGPGEPPLALRQPR